MDGDKRHECCRGSSMIYVILFITLLGVFSCGYMAVSRFNLRSTLNSRNYMEAQLTAKTIHRSFCEAVSSGESEAMNLIWQSFDADCDRVSGEYEEMAGEGEMTGDEEEQDRWDRYLHHALGNKKYVVHGTGEKPEDDLTTDITLTAEPLKAKASVHSRIICNGFIFSLRADIVFDNSDGAVMTIGGSAYRRAGAPVEIYLSGNGVYRYYED